jgi:hypothetical protein
MGKKLLIDADSLYRAVTAGDYRVIAHYLDDRNGKILALALARDPRASTLETPRLGSFCKSEKDSEAQAGGNPAAEFLARKAREKKPLFHDEGAKEEPFAGGFWQNEKQTMANPFDDGATETAAERRRLAALFADDAPKPKAHDPFAALGKPAKAAEVVEDDMDFDHLHRIPSVEPELWTAWRRWFVEKEVGDPEVRDKLRRTLHKDVAPEVFEETLERYQHTDGQWRRFIRKKALAAACAWLETMPLDSWNLVEPSSQA